MDLSKFTPPFRAFFDRSQATIDGFFTIQDAKGRKIINRLLCRSGQAGYTYNSWQSGKSPIPFNNEVLGGRLYLFLKPIKNKKTLDPDGIGVFYPISSSLENRATIVSANRLQTRVAIGCHPENKFRGSAGCIVWRWDNNKLKEQTLRCISLLEEIGKIANFIELTVL